MNVFDAIKSRRSVRNYKDEDIPQDILARILETFKWGPLAGNIPHLTAIVVQDEKVKKNICDACVEQDDWIQDVPTFIVVCSDTKKLESTFGYQGKNYAIQGTAVATQNILLTAEELGVNSCWIGAFSEGKLKRSLKIPHGIDIHNIIALGYAIRVPKAPLKPIINKIVKFNSWSSPLKDQKKFPAFWESKTRSIGKKLPKTVSRLKKKLRKK